MSITAVVDDFDTSTRPWDNDTDWLDCKTPAASRVDALMKLITGRGNQAIAPPAEWIADKSFSMRPQQ